MGFLARIKHDYGLLVLLLLVTVVFAGFLLWKLIWNVWSAAMRAKDEEIERLVKERDRYQRLVFEGLKSSAVDLDGLMRHFRKRSGEVSDEPSPVGKRKRTK